MRLWVSQRIYESPILREESKWNALATLAKNDVVVKVLTSAQVGGITEIILLIIVVDVSAKNERLAQQTWTSEKQKKNQKNIKKKDKKEISRRGAQICVKRTQGHKQASRESTLAHAHVAYQCRALLIHFAGAFISVLR